ncbi:MAG: conserved rane protein of unknown function [Blastococcus sp.]|nr:conserved rane protein of unknown function [Blastococcus sp.]
MTGDPVTGDPVSGDPWADPATPTVPGAPYAGPPQTAPNAPPQWGAAPDGYPIPSGYPPPYGHPLPWAPPPPRGPSRPGQVIGAAVLSFVQAGLVLLSSLYLWMVLSIAHIATRQQPTRAADALVTEGTVLAAVQAVSVAALIAAGIVALNRRSGAAWLMLVGAHLVQVILAAYWVIRVHGVFSDVAGPTPGDALGVFSLFYAAAPLVAVGLVVSGSGRHWFDGTPRR